MGKLSLSNDGEPPKIGAYPCWSMQEEGNCASLQNVVDIFVDQQGILWVLDTGVVNTLEKPVRKCPPKVVAFNLNTDKVKKKKKKKAVLDFFLIANKNKSKNAFTSSLLK